MASKQNLEYVYNYPAYTLEGVLLSQYEFQLVTEDVINQLVSSSTTNWNSRSASLFW